MHAHVYCTQVAVFILVALLANAFPHLNTTPPILFISHICGKERASDMAEERVPERHRGACMCARRHTEAGVMRVGASWWCNLFHPSSLCSPLPLAEAQRASSHCLLHCNLPSFAAKRRNQLTSFSTHHLLQNSSEDKLAFSGGVAERKVKKKKKKRRKCGTRGEQEGDWKRSAGTQLLSRSEDDVNRRRQLPAERCNSPPEAAPVSLNAGIMFKKSPSAAANLLAQHCESTHNYSVSGFTW